MLGAGTCGLSADAFLLFSFASRCLLLGSSDWSFYNDRHFCDLAYGDLPYMYVELPYGTTVVDKKIHKFEQILEKFLAARCNRLYVAASALVGWLPIRFRNLCWPRAVTCSASDALP